MPPVLSEIANREQVRLQFPLVCPRAVWPNKPAPLSIAIDHGRPPDIPAVLSSGSYTARASVFLLNFGPAQFFTPTNLAVPLAEFDALGTRWRSAGLRLVAAPQAVVVHTHPLTAMRFLRQQYRDDRRRRASPEIAATAGHTSIFIAKGFWIHSASADNC